MKKKCILCTHSIACKGNLCCVVGPPSISTGKEFPAFPAVKTDTYCHKFSRSYWRLIYLLMISKRRHKQFAIERPKAFNLSWNDRLLMATERDTGRKFVYTLYGWIPEEKYDRSNP